MIKQIDGEMKTVFEKGYKLPVSKNSKSEFIDLTVEQSNKKRKQEKIP